MFLLLQLWSTAWNQRKVIPLEVLLMYRIVVVIMTCLFFRMKLSTIYKELCWNFDGNSFESVDCFSRLALFTIWILLIHENEKSFHLPILYFISFFSVWKFYYTSLSFACLELLPRYFLKLLWKVLLFDFFLSPLGISEYSLCVCWRFVFFSDEKLWLIFHYLPLPLCILLTWRSIFSSYL